MNARYGAVKCLHEIIHNQKYHNTDNIRNKIISKEVPLFDQIRLGVVQNYYFLEILLKQFLSKSIKDSYVQIVLMVAIYQLHYLDCAKYAVVNESGKICKLLNKQWAVAFVNAILRSYIRTKKHRVKKTETAIFNHSQEIIDLYKNCYPQDWQTILLNNNKSATLCLRLNTTKTNIKDFAYLLEKNNYKAVSYFGTQGIIINDKVKVENLPNYKEKFFYVQNRSAMLAAPLLMNSYELSNKKKYKKITILDMCASPGGKTTHLLELLFSNFIINNANTLPSKFFLIANDKNLARIKLLKQNLQSYFEDFKTIKVDLKQNLFVTNLDFSQNFNQLQQKLFSQEKKLLSLVANKKIEFDCVLLDAPCTATGIIRRHPEIRFRLNNKEITKLTNLQAKLLQNAFNLLKAGGTLLYCTCSVLPQENDHQLAKLVAQNQNITINKSENYSKHIDRGNKTKYGWQILPEQEWDGFYYSVIQKASNSNNAIP